MIAHLMSTVPHSDWFTLAYSRFSLEVQAEVSCILIKISF